MSKRILTPRILFTLLTLGLSILIHQSVVADPDETLAPASSPGWEDPTNITNNTYGSRLASVVGAPDGNTVIVAYSKQLSGTESDTDPYYRRSLNNGQNWSSEARIHRSDDVRSTQIDLDFGSNNVAHAIWREGDTEIHYAAESDWANSTTNTEKLSLDLGKADAPQIDASSNNRINAVWAEGVGGIFDIYYARSKNGGSSWPIKGVVEDTSDLSLRPALAVSGNTVHVVWEEGLFSAQIFYRRGSVNESTNTVSWSNRIVISSASGATNAKQPQIMLAGTTIHVSYTERISEDQQYIHHIQCSSGCQNNVNNWQSANNPISGQVLDVHASDPFDIISTMTQLGNCTHVYFHGLRTGNNEQILGVNSCDGWAASARDQVTPTSYRAVNPSMSVQNNWWVYLVYDEFVNTNTRQIRFVRNEPGIYLPFIITK